MVSDKLGVNVKDLIRASSTESLSLLSYTLSFIESKPYEECAVILVTKWINDELSQRILKK